MSIRLKDNAPQNLSGQIAKKLSEWTGQRWMVSLSREEGASTLAEAAKSEENAVLEEVKAHPLVSEVLRVFPGAKIAEIKDKK